ncbi:MAG: hypothetical protein FD164_209 [Nitrospirae bacterium]|nr:MAG: hypothetical protein FD164_209 [Nitrospirota bacterium]
MKRIVCAFSIALVIFFLCGMPVQAASFLDNLWQQSPAGSSKQSDMNIARGLKEALSVGTENAVKNVGRSDGYFGNQLIRILMPEKMRKVTDTLSMLGYKKEVDEFVLSMNRAAEKAAPQAGAIFADSIRQMTIEDARKILSGNDTAATEYFRSKSSGKLTDAFKPIISKSLDDVGSTRAYKNLLQKADSVPLLKKESVDLDTYVTSKALDGLFTIVGQEEKRIRTDPAARVTDLLRSTFGR